MIPEFTQAELLAFHRWCLKYRALVRGGGTRNKEQGEQFQLFSKACYAYGVAYEDRG